MPTRNDRLPGRPLNAIELEAVARFRQQMRDVVIPQTEKLLLERATLANEARHIVLRQGSSSVS